MDHDTSQLSPEWAIEERSLSTDTKYMRHDDTETDQSMPQCEVCTHNRVFFTVIFPDGFSFDLCEGCTNDLIALQDSHFVFSQVVIVAYGSASLDSEETFNWSDETAR